MAKSERPKASKTKKVEDYLDRRTVSADFLINTDFTEEELNYIANRKQWKYSDKFDLRGVRIQKASKTYDEYLQESGIKKKSKKYL